MIPVFVPSANFFLLLGLGFWALVALLIWSGLLVFVKGARATFRRHLKKSVLLLILLALPAAFFCLVRYTVWNIEREAEVDEQARHFTLSQTQQVGGIALPAGTRIATRRPHDPALFEEAVFPAPTALWEIQATGLRRFLRFDTQKETYVPEEAHVNLATDQRVHDWLCSKAQPAEFHWPERGEASPSSSAQPPPDFQACQLAEGNRIGPWPVPAGARVQASPSSSKDNNERWMVRIEPDHAAPMPWLGMSLRSAMIYLDARRAPLRVSDGELAADWTLGPLSHRAGERVGTAPEPWRSQFPGALMFSPAQGQAAPYQGHPDLPFGSTAIQTPDGKVHAIVPNAQAGVFEFATIIVK